MEHDDLDLLREYGERRSQPAFARLVERYVNLVYTSACRQLRDRHAAEDVTQAVFLILSKKAGSMKPGVVLPGWLLSTTRFACREAIRARGRRQRHEHRAAEHIAAGQRAASMRNSDPSTSFPPSADERQSELESVLDDAMAKLGGPARDAVVLRYFQNKSYKQVGEQLGISEEAAKQRVFRGLQRLRQLLGGKRDALPLEGLGMMLLGCAVRPAPPHVIAAVTQAFAAGSTATAASTGLAKGAMHLMAWTKAKLALASAAAILFVGGAGATAVHYYTHRGDDEGVRVTPPGAAPITPSLGSAGMTPAPPAYRGDPVVGVVRLPDGKPLAGAEVSLCTIARTVSAYAPQSQWMPPPQTVTGADGRFEFFPPEQPVAVVVNARQGFARARTGDLKRHPDLTVTPWGRVEGVALIGSKPAARTKVHLGRFGSADEWNRWHISFELDLRTDAEGKFAIERVAPGEAVVSRLMDNSPMPLHEEPIDVAAGKTTRVRLGGVGRPLVGTVNSAPTDANYRMLTLQPMKVPSNGVLAALHFMTAHADSERVYSYEYPLDADGSFRVEDVPPGTYALMIQLGRIDPGSMYVESVATAQSTVTMPQVPGGQSDEPLKIGPIKLTLTPSLKLGDPVPEVAGRSADGSSVKLSDFRGKSVLLHFWSDNRGDTLEQLDTLRPAFDRFGDDPRVAFVGFNVDDAERANGAIAKHPLGWPQGVLGGWEKIPREMTASPSLIFVVGPDGKLAGKNLDGVGAYALLDRLLSGRGNQ